MNAQPNSERLILARNIRGMTQTRLAEISGVDQGTISKYEGQVMPMLDHDIEKLAQSLSFPTEFFYRPGELHGAESGEIFHRKYQSLSAEKLRLIHSHLVMLRLNVETLLAPIVIDRAYEIPRYNVREFDGDIETIASLVRSFWEIPSGPVINLIERLEAASCIIHVLDFATDQIDETVQWIDPLPPIILVNSRAPGDRLRFTLSHMLGHLVLHHDEIPYPEMEQEADAFAAAFLMPADDIRPELQPVTIDHLMQLKPRWGVSIQALIHRARDLGEIDERRYRSLFQMLSRAGYRKNEPFRLAPERPQLLKKIIGAHLSKGNDTEKLARLLAISEDDFKNWYLSKAA